MKTSRIRRACALGALALLAPLGALAQSAPYPSQPIKFIVPYPAGGATDTLARTVGQKLSEAWGSPCWWKTRLAPRAPSATTSSPRRRRTATPCWWPLQR